MEGRTFGDISEESLAGKTYTVLPTYISDSEVSQKIYIKKIDNYILSIIFTYYGENGLTADGQFKEYNSAGAD